jgi:hypothetical protein
MEIMHSAKSREDRKYNYERVKRGDRWYNHSEAPLLSQVPIRFF